MGTFLIDERELAVNNYVVVEAAANLSLLDLRDDGAVRMGIPSDVGRGSSQGFARKWSVAFHDHPSSPDGIIYPSRLNGETNVAVYDRAIAKLRANAPVSLLRAVGLAHVLDNLKVGLA